MPYVSAKASVNKATFLALYTTHYLWAALIARIYEVFPLITPARGPPLPGHCGGTAAGAGLCPSGVSASLCFDRRANSWQIRRVTVGASLMRPTPHGRVNSN